MMLCDCLCFFWVLLLLFMKCVKSSLSLSIYFSLVFMWSSIAAVVVLFFFTVLFSLLVVFSYRIFNVFLAQSNFSFWISLISRTASRICRMNWLPSVYLFISWTNKAEIESSLGGCAGLANFLLLLVFLFLLLEGWWCVLSWEKSLDCGGEEQRKFCHCMGIYFWKVEVIISIN